MIGASKILTVSYGTFSCTLEGFDEPFNTMKAIAEYFRDLAADDRYFGAEPPTPDAAMLHRIAEREVQRRVEAKVQDNGVILRAADLAPTPTAPQPPKAPQPGATALLSEESVAAKLQRIRAAVSRAAVPVAVPVAALLVEEAVFIEDEHAAPILTTVSFAEAEPVPAMPEAVLEPEVVAQDAVMQDASEPEAAEPEMAELATAETPVVDIHVEWQAIDAVEEADAGAELTQTEADQDEVFDDDDMPASETAYFDAATLAIIAGALPNAEPQNFAADLTAHWASPSSDTAPVEMFESDDLPEATPALTAEDLPEAAAEADDADLIAALSTAEPADAPAPDSAADADLGDFLAGLSAAEAAPRPEAFAEVDDLQHDAAGAATAMPAWDDDTEEFDDEPVAVQIAWDAAEDDQDAEEAFDDDADLPDAATATWPADPEMNAPIADEGALQADPSPAAEKLRRARARVIKVRRPDAPVVAPLTPEAEDDLQRELAAVEIDAEATRHAEREGRTILENSKGDEDVTRLLRQTNTEMDGPENRRRMSTLAHLKAAVAATVAELRSPGAPSENGEASRLDRYRADLARVVRPRRSTDAAPAERPAPLVLVSEQRIDRPAAAAMSRVMPRRVTAGNLAFEEEADADDVVDAQNQPEAENIFASSKNFIEFADRLGAVDLPDLLEAAAAYTACIEGRPHFTRPHLMRHVAAVTEDNDMNREDSMRSFGQLLRQGKIEKVKRGQFAITDSSYYLAEARRMTR